MKYLNNHIIILLLLAIISSCQKETVVPPGPVDGEEIEITFSIIAGGMATKAMNDEAENYIDEIDILVFKQGYLVDHAMGKEIEDIEPEDNKFRRKSFEVVLKTDNANNNCLVILGNARESISELISNGKLNGKKETLLQQLVFENTSNDKRWPARLDGSTDFRPIPMWGERDNISIDKNLEQSLTTTPIELFRALARIDLSLANNITQDNFELTHVYFHKYNTKGCVVPGSNAEWDDHPYTGEKRVRNVTVPSDPNTQKNTLTYTISNSKECKGQIYVLEIDRTQNDNYPEATCLVVAGKYNRNTQTSYYRIDFEIIWDLSNESPPRRIVEAGPGISGGSGRSFARMLRNHVYDITIVKVSTEGASSLEEALGNQAKDLEVKAAVWANKSLNVILE